MKKKKLSLKKDTITNLSDLEMKSLNGGAVQTQGVCETEAIGPFICNTDVVACYATLYNTCR